MKRIKGMGRHDFAGGHCPWFSGNTGDVPLRLFVCSQITFPRVKILVLRNFDTKDLPFGRSFEMEAGEGIG